MVTTTSVRKFVPPLNSSSNPLLLGREGGFGASPSPRLCSPSLRKRGGRGVSFGGGDELLNRCTRKSGLSKAYFSYVVEGRDDNAV